MVNKSKESVFAKKSKLRSSCGVLVALGALVLISTETFAATCAVSSSSLRGAKAQYAQMCSEKRVDCDRIKGQWYCANVKMAGSAPRVIGIEKPSQQVNAVYQNSVVQSPVPIDVADTQAIDSASIFTLVKPEIIVADASCVDSDGDGWGWNGVASCRMVAVNFPLTNTQNIIPTVSSTTSSSNTRRLLSDSDNCTKLDSGNYHITELVTDVVLTAGQSNAAGNETKYQPEIYQQDRVNDRFIVWTSNNIWEIANPKTQVWHGNRSYPLSYHGAFNHPGFQIGRAIASADKCRVVALIATAAPGEPIDYWLYNEESHLSYIRQKVTAGLNALPGRYKLDMIWWMQGESDNDQIVRRYYSKLHNLINLFRSEPWFQEDGYFVANETLNSLYANQAIRQLDVDGNVYTSSSRGENKRGDRFSQISRETNTGVHFGAESLRKIGDLVAGQYLDEYLPVLGR